MSEIPGILDGLHQKIDFVQSHIDTKYPDRSTAPHHLARTQDILNQSRAEANKAKQSFQTGDVSGASTFLGNSSRLLTQALGKYTKLVPAEDIPYQLANMSMGTPVIDHQQLVEAANKERNNGR
jgi:hypothetical protein